jgi:hypothetical protein
MPKFLVRFGRDKIIRGMVKKASILKDNWTQRSAAKEELSQV